MDNLVIVETDDGELTYVEGKQLPMYKVIEEYNRLLEDYRSLYMTNTANECKLIDCRKKLTTLRNDITMASIDDHVLS